MDIRTLFAGLERRWGVSAIVTTALVSVLLFSCEDVKPDFEENTPAFVTVHGVVRGIVRSSITGGPLSGANVTLAQDGKTVETAQTFEDGSYSFTDIEAGAGYTVTAGAPIYIESQTAAFAVSETHIHNIMLDRDWPSEGTVAAASVNAKGIVFAPDGTLYFTDSGANKIWEIAPGGSTAVVYAGAGVSGVEDGVLAAATFNNPFGIAVSADGSEMYVTDLIGCRVRHITGGEVLTIAGSGSLGYYTGYRGDGGDAKMAQLYFPQGIAVDAAGNLYIADNWNDCIREISADGVISTIAGRGASTEDSGPALSAMLAKPVGIALDAQENIYITDENRLRKITRVDGSSRVIETLSHGTDEVEFSSVIGGIAIDAAGTVYVADSSNHRVVKVLADGTASLLAGNGRGSNNDQLNYPTNLAIGPDGCLYIADINNRRIIKY